MAALLLSGRLGEPVEESVDDDACLDKSVRAPFPAEHWKHLRTTNVIEKLVRDRASSHRALEGVSHEQDRMIFKLAEAAERSWHRLNGHNQLPKIILGVQFSDGIEVVRSQAQAAAA